MTAHRRRPRGCSCLPGTGRADCPVHGVPSAELLAVEDEMRRKAEARLAMFPGDDYVGELIAWSRP